MPNQPPAPAASSGSLKDWCRLLFVLLSFLALLPLIGVLSIILVGPLKPKFDLQSGEVQYLNIAADNITGTAAASITLTIRLVFIADNPNKMEMKYGESRFAVLYNDILLGNASIPG
ncbi:uncharacterized protein LOC130725654 [Lotus japonicus]|uniref:uncharacterized protein LOC130725654 n=1 Tax=Lotus japonicus TaxID=34305 RepID=UPI0025892062|nr:uncharacterized protein LOC130725654 [Lotus japonicus]